MSLLPFNFKHTNTGLRPLQMVAGLSALSLAALLAFAGPAGAAAADPAGNNGTIKIDDVTLNDPTDDAPNNEPHPGCNFEVDFYGFDAGVDHYATVTFAVHNATRGDDVLEAHPEAVFIGGDANDGGGSETGFDASQFYNLYQALTDGGYEPGRMGYHIKLTVHADGSIGADTKHKVFWVTDCVPPVNDDVIIDDEIIDDEIIDDEIIDDEIIDDEIVVIEEDDETEVKDENGNVVVDQNDTPGTSVGAPQVSGSTNGNVPEVAVSGAGAAKSPGNDALILGRTLARPDVSASPGGLVRTGSAVAPSLVLAATLLMLGALARRLGRVRTVTQP